MIPPRRMTPQQMMMMQLLLRRQMGNYAMPRSNAQPQRTYTSQQAQTLQGLGNVERYDKKTGRWVKTGTKRRKT
jgi:hypothetical protein